MALDSKLLAQEIVNAIAPKGMKSSDKKTMITAWTKIAKVIIEHFQKNAEVNVSAQVIKTNDSSGALTDVSITAEQTTIYDGNGQVAPASYSHLRGKLV